MLTDMLEPGWPDVEVICTPGVWPCMACSGLVVLSFWMSSPLTWTVAPVTSFFFWTP